MRPSPSRRSEELEQLLQQHVLREIRTAGWGGAPEEAEDVARGIAHRWSEEGGENPIPSDYLALLIARALWSLGAREAARRLVDRNDRGTEGDLARHTLDRLPPSLPVWRCLKARLIRGGTWSAAGGDPVWVLDLGRVSGLDGEPLELAWFPVIQLLLSGMAELWDATRGRGFLGLRGVRPAGKKAEREQADYVEAVLIRLKQRRGWTDMPHWVWLDRRPR